jgi:hypothetical protein
MVRSWRFITMTGSAQPLFGDLLTAAFTGKRGKEGLYLATVADTTKYQVGDRVIFGFGQAKPNLLMVDQLVSSTVLGLASEGNASVSAWGNGAQLCLSIACAQIVAQAAVLNAGNTYFGNDNTVTNTGGGSAFGEAGPSSSWNYGVGQWNIVRTSEIWIAGAASDKLGVSAVVI